MSAKQDNPQGTLHVLIVAHEDDYNVDPEDPRVFGTVAALEDYLERRGFSNQPSRGGWGKENREGYHIYAHISSCKVRRMDEER